jgi:hypothetical protein
MDYSLWAQTHDADAHVPVYAPARSHRSHPFSRAGRTRSEYRAVGRSGRRRRSRWSGMGDPIVAGGPRAVVDGVGRRDRERQCWSPSAESNDPCATTDRRPSWSEQSDNWGQAVTASTPPWDGWGMRARFGARLQRGRSVSEARKRDPYRGGGLMRLRCHRAACFAPRTVEGQPPSSKERRGALLRARSREAGNALAVRKSVT